MWITCNMKFDILFLKHCIGACLKIHIIKVKRGKHRKLFIVVSRLPEPRQEERKDSVQLFFIKALSARFRSSGRGAAFFPYFKDGSSLPVYNRSG